MLHKALFFALFLSSVPNVNGAHFNQFQGSESPAFNTRARHLTKTAQQATTNDSVALRTRAAENKRKNGPVASRTRSQDRRSMPILNLRRLRLPIFRPTEFRLPEFRPIEFRLPEFRPIEFRFPEISEFRLPEIEWPPLQPLIRVMQAPTFDEIRFNEIRIGGNIYMSAILNPINRHETIIAGRDQTSIFIEDKLNEYTGVLADDPIQELNNAFHVHKSRFSERERAFIENQLKRLSTNNDDTVLNRLRVAIAIITDESLMQNTQTLEDRWKAYFDGAFLGAAFSNAMKNKLSKEDILENPDIKRAEACDGGFEEHIINGLVGLHPGVDDLYRAGQQIEEDQFNKAKKTLEELKKDEEQRKKGAILTSINTSSLNFLQTIPQEQKTIEQFLREFDEKMTTLNAEEGLSESNTEEIKAAIYASREMIKDALIEKDKLLKGINELLGSQIEQIKQNHESNKANGIEDSVEIITRKQVIFLKGEISKRIDEDEQSIVSLKETMDRDLQEKVKDYVTLILWA